MRSGYQDSAFRILGLTANATRRMVRDVQQSLRIRAKAGGRLNIADPLSFLNRLEPTETRLRDAFNRLENPVSRLRERLFWFEASREIDNRAINELKAGNITAAIECWQADDSPLSQTNLARLYHAISLPDSEVNNINYWRLALKYWQQTLASDYFWTHLWELEQSAGFEPPATRADIDRLQADAWQILLEPSRDYLQQAINNNNQTIAQRHFDLLRNCGAPNSFINQIDRVLTEHAERDIERLSNEIIAQLSDNIERLTREKKSLEARRRACDLAYRSFQQELLPKLSRLTQTLNNDADKLVPANELVAVCLRRLANYYLEEGESFANFKRLLLEAVELVPDSRLALQIQEELLKVSRRAIELFIKRGNDYQQAERYSEAITAYRQVLEIEPDYTPAQLQLGNVYRKIGRYQDALTAYQQVIKFEPHSFEAQFQMGFLYNRMARSADALSAFQQAIQINPRNAEAQYQLGLTYSDLQQSQAAIECYHAALRDKPNYAEALYQLGLAYSRTGARTEAINALKKALALSRDNIAAHYQLGLLYQEMNSHSEAIVAFQQVIRYKQNYAEAHYQSGLSYQQLDQFMAAIDAFQLTIRYKPADYNAHYQLAQIYLKLERTSEALQTIKQAIFLKPDLITAHYLMGLIQLKLGDRAEAKRAWLKTIQLDPDHQEARQQLATISDEPVVSIPDSLKNQSARKPGKEPVFDAEYYYQMGIDKSNLPSADAAIEAFQQALQQKSNHSGALAKLGALYSKNHRYQEALDCHQKLVRLDPNDANAHYNLGVAQSQVGDYRSSIESYQRSIMLKSHNRNAYFALGVVYSRLKDYPAAIAAYRNVINIQESDAAAYYNLGVIYRNLGQAQQARESFQQASHHNPQMAEAHYQLGLIFQKSEKRQEAKLAFEKVLRIKPEHQDARSQLKNIDQEINSYQSAFEASPIFSVFSGKTNIRPEKSSTASAVTNSDTPVTITTEPAVQKQPINNSSTTPTDSIAAFQEAINRDPDNADGYYNLGVAYSKAGLYDQALHAYKEAVLRNPAHPRSYFAMGVAYSKLLRDQEAVGAYKLALQQRPEDGAIYFNLGQALRKLARDQEAIDAYQKALKLKPNDVAALYNLAQSMSNLRLYREAINAYQNVIELQPEHARAHFGLALAYLSIGDLTALSRQQEILTKLDAGLAQELIKIMDE